LSSVSKLADGGGALLGSGADAGFGSAAMGFEVKLCFEGLAGQIGSFRCFAVGAVFNRGGGHHPRVVVIGRARLGEMGDHVLHEACFGGVAEQGLGRQPT